MAHRLDRQASLDGGAGANGPPDAATGRLGSDTENREVQVDIAGADAGDLGSDVRHAKLVPGPDPFVRPFSVPGS